MFEQIVSLLNRIVWSPALVILLVGAGLYFTLRTRFVQVRRFGLDQCPRPAHPLPPGDPRPAGIRAITQRRPPASRRKGKTAPEPALVLAVETGFAESAANAYL